MNTKNAQNRCLVPKESVLLKTVVFWHKSKLEIINKKSVLILWKGLIFWCENHKFWSEWQDSNLRHRRPKRRALPAAPHPERLKILNFWGFSVSGQTCGQTAFYSDFERAYIAEKVSVYKGFRHFSGFHNEGAVSCSQSKRATTCATSRSIKL